MSYKFLNLVENTINRMTNGGILVGDRVTLVDGYKSKSSFKNLPDAVQAYITDLFKSDLNKKIINIKTEMPSVAPGNSDNRAASFFADVAVELANGLFDNKNAVTVPADLLHVNSDDINRSPVPDSQRYDNKVKISPEEVKEEDENDQQTMTQQGDTLKKSARYLPRKNIKIPSSPASPSPAVNESYTSQYMPQN
jgi:hypothetical protein